MAEEQSGRMIHVPDVQPPTDQLCWKQNVNMSRCDRRADHSGMHTWEYVREIRRLEELLTRKK